MTDQKLTDELEKALRDEAYDGGMGALSPEKFTDYVRGLAVTAAKVVAEAHTRTDEEREALLTEADALVASWDQKGSWSSDSPVGMVMRLAAALRRSEQPTDDEREAQANRYIAARGDSQTRRDFLAGWDAAIRRTEVPEPSAERRDLTPCGNLVCTGCRVCGCPALGIAPQAAPTDDEREALRRALRGIVEEGIDAREAVEAVLAEGFRLGGPRRITVPTPIQDRIEAIRRTEVPEPSADMIAPEEGMTLEELGEAISNWSPEWDGDEAMHSLIDSFLRHYAALDGEVYAARESTNFDEDAEILFRYDHEKGTLVLHTPEPQGEPSDAQVEAAAQALFEPDGPGGDYTWAEMVIEDPSRADIWREDARKVLRAAGGAR